MRIQRAVLLGLIVLLVITSPGMARAETEKVDIFLNGQVLSYPDQQPIIDGESIMVPLRYTVEKMGLTVDWDRETQSALINQDGDLFCFIPARQEVMKNKKTLSGWQELKCVNGRIIVPLNLVADVFGYQMQKSRDKVILTPKPMVITSELSVQKVREKIYVVVHNFPWSCNSLLVEMNDGQLVLIDTPNTPEATRDLLQWIGKKFVDRKITAFNTHFHFDCLGGNQALLEKNIKIYGSELTAKMIEERGEAVRIQTISSLSGPENQRYREAYEKIPYITPTPLSGLEDGRSLDFNGEKLEIYYPGEAHAPDNLVLYFPQKQILFGGCMVKSINSKTIGNTSDANLNAWPRSIQKVIERYPEADLVIPGHGAWGSTELLLHTLNLVNAAS